MAEPAVAFVDESASRAKIATLEGSLCELGHNHAHGRPRLAASPHQSPKPPVGPHEFSLSLRSSRFDERAPQPIGCPSGLLQARERVEVPSGHRKKRCRLARASPLEDAQAQAAPSIRLGYMLLDRCVQLDRVPPRCFLLIPLAEFAPRVRDAIAEASPLRQLVGL